MTILPAHEQRGLWDGTLLTFDELPSTNRWALDQLARLGNGDVVRAVRQTAGRGRFDREWVAPGDRALTLSVVLRPRAGAGPAPAAIVMAAALAVRECLGSRGMDALLKWPNDVLVEGRKIAGILAEATSGDSALVVGIGLNVNLTQDDLDRISPVQPATSMLLATGCTCDVDRVLADLLSAFERVLVLFREQGTSALLHPWRANDALAGKRIAVRGQDGALEGEYAGIDETGRLRLKAADGTISTHWSGDVSVRE